jgi:hypothetical protein
VDWMTARIKQSIRVPARASLRFGRKRADQKWVPTACRIQTDAPL